MNLRPGNNVVALRGRVIYFDLWEARPSGQIFRKIWIERQSNRFLLQSDWFGNGQMGFNGRSTIEATLEGLDEAHPNFVKMAIKVFSLENIKPRDLIALTPNHRPTFLHKRQAICILR